MVNVPGGKGHPSESRATCKKGNGDGRRSSPSWRRPPREGRVLQEKKRKRKTGGEIRAAGKTSRRGKRRRPGHQKIQKKKVVIPGGPCLERAALRPAGGKEISGGFCWGGGAQGKGAPSCRGTRPSWPANYIKGKKKPAQKANRRSSPKKGSAGQNKPRKTGSSRALVRKEDVGAAVPEGIGEGGKTRPKKKPKKGAFASQKKRQPNHPPSAPR